MKKNIIRRDILIERISVIFIHLSTYCFLGTVIIYGIKNKGNPAPPSSYIYQYHQFVQEISGFSEAGVLYLMVSPMYIYFPLCFVILLIRAYWLYPDSKFTVYHCSKIVKKEVIHTYDEESSEIIDTHFNIKITSPFNEKRTLFFDKMSFSVFKDKQIGDEVTLRTTPNGRWVALLEY